MNSTPKLRLEYAAPGARWYYPRLIWTAVIAVCIIWAAIAAGICVIAWYFHRSS